MAEVLFRAKLQRDDSQNRWGFCLQGGADCKKPLTLLQVAPESFASKGGLMPGDIVVKLAGQSATGMTHGQAQQTIIKAGNILEIIVERSEEIASPTAVPDVPPFPPENQMNSGGLPLKEETQQEDRKVEGKSNSSPGQDLVVTEDVIFKTTADPFPVTSILKSNIQEMKPVNNVKVKLAGKGKSVKFLDQSPPRKYRHPSPSPVRYRRRKQSLSPNRTRSRSAPAVSYTRVRITDTSRNRPVQDFDRKLNVIPAKSVSNKSSNNENVESTTGDMISDSEHEDEVKQASDPRYPWRRSRADITRRADLFKEEMEKKLKLKEKQLQEKLHVAMTPSVTTNMQNQSDSLQTELSQIPHFIQADVSQQYISVKRPSVQEKEFISNVEKDPPSPVGIKSSSSTPHNIHTISMAPEVADLPVPAVKEIVYDLNRRLEALAARQPELSKPLTPQELGISFLRKEITSPPSRASVDDDDQQYASDFSQLESDSSTAGVKPAQSDQSSSCQKIYDVASPISSPTLGMKQLNLDFENIPETCPHYVQKKVTFAEPLEQYHVFEQRDKDSARTMVTSGNMHDIGPHIAPGVQYSYHVPTRQFEISVSQSHVETPRSKVRLSVPMNQPTKQAYHFNISTSGIEVHPKPPPSVNTPVSLQYSYPPSYADAMYASSQGVKAAENIPHLGVLLEAGLVSSNQSQQSPAVHSSMLQIESLQPNSPLLSPNQHPPNPLLSPKEQINLLATSRQGYVQPVHSGVPLGQTPVRHSSPPVAEHEIQSRSFKNLENRFAEGGNIAPPDLTTQSRVPHPAAAAKPFYPSGMEIPMQTMMPSSLSSENIAIQPLPAPSQGLRYPASHTQAAAISLGDKSPGLIAIFDRNFTEKLLQWQQERSRGVQPHSETYHLVHEMDLQGQSRSPHHKDVSDW